MVAKPPAPGEPPGDQSDIMDEGGGPSGLIEDRTWMYRAERVVAFVPALILFAMMVLTVVSVFVRYVLRSPISGAFEIMSYMMGLLVFLSLILVALRSDHVRISLLDGSLPTWLRQARAMVVNLMLSGMSGWLGWQLWRFGARLESWGEKTQIYGLPTGLLAKIMAGSTLICAVLFLLLAIKVARDRAALNRVET